MLISYLRYTFFVVFFETEKDGCFPFRLSLFLYLQLFWIFLAFLLDQLFSYLTLLRTGLVTQFFFSIQTWRITVKILKFGTPQTIAIIVLKIEKFDVTFH